MKLDKETILGLKGEFIWFWGADWFIETEQGNFHWKDPDYGEGDNTIAPFPGDLQQFCRKMHVQCGRGKGVKMIGQMCGDDVILVTDLDWLAERLYDMDPYRYEDRVDGLVTMGWLHAKEDNHPKAVQALAEAKQLEEMFSLGNEGSIHEKK